MKLTIEDVRSRFIEHFDGTTGSVYASPGRINLIGEHTDYNGGFVFPGAVQQGVIAEIKPNGTRKVRAYSIDLKDYVEFSLDDEKGPSATHFRFVFGVCREMMKLGVHVEGFNTAFAGAKLSAGFHHIEVRYEAPGFRVGLAVSLTGTAAWIAITSGEWILRRKKGRK